MKKGCQQLLEWLITIMKKEKLIGVYSKKVSLTKSGVNFFKTFTV
jgi:hypothetical protein